LKIVTLQKFYLQRPSNVVAVTCRKLQENKEFNQANWSSNWFRQWDFWIQRKA